MTFLNNYHKAIWAAKYDSILVRKNEDDEVEVCEDVLWSILNSILVLCICISIY